MSHPLLETPPLFRRPPIDPERDTLYARRLIAELWSPLYRTPPPQQGAAPLCLQVDAFRRLIRRSEALIQALMEPSVQARVFAEPFFLDRAPPQVDQLMGCVDVSVRGEEARVIEINVGPPGRLGMLASWEGLYWEVAGLDPRHRLNRAFEDQLVQAITAGGRHRRIGVVCSPLPSSDSARHSYVHMVDLLRGRGLEAELALPEDLAIGDGCPLVRGAPMDVLLNLAIVSRWRDNPSAFVPLSQVYAAFPQRLYPNPGNFTLGDKRMLADLYEHASRGGPGLSEATWREIREILLPTVRLSEVGSVAEVYERLGSDRIVLKPPDEDNGRGVMLLPGREEIARALANQPDNTLAQRYFAGDTGRLINADGQAVAEAVKLRLAFLGPRVCAVVAYAPVVGPREPRGLPRGYIPLPVLTYREP